MTEELLNIPQDTISSVADLVHLMKLWNCHLEARCIGHENGWMLVRNEKVI